MHNITIQFQSLYVFCIIKYLPMFSCIQVCVPMCTPNLRSKSLCLKIKRSLHAKVNINDSFPRIAHSVTSRVIINFNDPSIVSDVKRINHLITKMTYYGGWLNDSRKGGISLQSGTSNKKWNILHRNWFWSSLKGASN